MASASSSFEPDLTPCHCAADAKRQARLDELAEARRQLDEELALHQELGMDAEPRDQRPTQDIPVQKKPREGNVYRRERRPTADQLRVRAPTPPPARGPARDNNRRANEGANVDTRSRR
jgi:hypothetical protein